MNAVDTLTLVIEAQQKEIEQKGIIILFLTFLFLFAVLGLCLLIIYYQNRERYDHTK